MSVALHNMCLSFVSLQGDGFISCLLVIPCVGTVLAYTKLFLEQPVESKVPQLKELCIRLLNHLYASKGDNLCYLGTTFVISSHD